MMLLGLLNLLLLLFSLIHDAVDAGSEGNVGGSTGLSRPIHIGLSVDDHSFRDSFFLINSIVETSYSPRDIFFHIVAVNKDEITSHRLKTMIEEHILTCYPYFEQSDSNQKDHSTTYGSGGSDSKKTSSSKDKKLKSPEFTATSSLDSYFTHPGAFLDHSIDRIRFEVVAFHLPINSGFETQLLHFKRRIHHWNSASGADMVRFYLPKLFPNTDKILYLDNDIIVSCCLEEIYDSYLPNGKAIGIILDDLKWATITQFERHYNASHPLVIKHMTRQAKLNPTGPAAVLAAESLNKLHSKTKNGKTVTDISSFSIANMDHIPKDYFMNLVPRYPNDGVILFNTTAYQEYGILEDMNEIAMANGQGEYVVNMGTQQFTVLTMYDRWEELSPRGNLRHFPDMARGYLMWFYYNGFVHYAGQSKPRLLCSMTSFKENNWLRVQSYTAWLNNHYLLARQCILPESTSKVRDLFYPHCIADSQTEQTVEQTQDIQVIAAASTAAVKALQTNTNNHIIHAKTTLELFYYIDEIMKTSLDMDNLYIKIIDNSFASTSNIDNIVHSDSLTALYEALSYYRNTSLVPCPLPIGLNDITQKVMRTLDSMILFKTLWGIRLYHNPPVIESENERQTEIAKRVDALKDGLSDASLAYHKLHPLVAPQPPPSPDAGKKKGRKAPPPPPKIILDANRRSVRTFHDTVCRLKGDLYLPLPSSHPRTYVRNDSDFAPLYDRFPCLGILPHIKAEDKKHWDALVISISMSTVSASLHSLYSLDTVFMRPKIILIHLHEIADTSIKSSQAIVDGVNRAMKYLRRIGFLAGFQYTGVPDDGCIDIEHREAAKKLKLSSINGVTEAYVWGLRANKLEFR